MGHLQHFVLGNYCDVNREHVCLQHAKQQDTRAVREQLLEADVTTTGTPGEGATYHILGAP